MRAAVFLDRDGVLVEAVVREGRALAPLDLSEFRLVPDAPSQVARLRRAGLPCMVFTNQPEIARGLLSPSHLGQMHARLRNAVDVDDVYVCPHEPQEGCDCHKPRPGLLRAAARDRKVDLRRSFVIGDRWRDIEAELAVGCYTVLIARPYSACTTAHAAVAKLSDAVDIVLDRFRRKVPWTS